MFAARAGHGRKRRHQSDAPTITTEETRAWFAGQIPDDWFTEPVDVVHDRDEIIVTGTLAAPAIQDGDDVDVAARARASAFREETREQRIRIAERAEAALRRKVSWVVRVGDQTVEYTTANVPVMTRLTMPERQVLDTLIAAGLARSRSEALAWCVRLVADNESDWIDRLRTAMEDLESVRDEGPASRT